MINILSSHRDSAVHSSINNITASTTSNNHHNNRMTLVMEMSHSHQTSPVLNQLNPSHEYASPYYDGDYLMSNIDKCHHYDKNNLLEVGQCQCKWTHIYIYSESNCYCF